MPDRRNMSCKIAMDLRWPLRPSGRREHPTLMRRRNRLLCLRPSLEWYPFMNRDSYIESWIRQRLFWTLSFSGSLIILDQWKLQLLQQTRWINRFRRWNLNRVTRSMFMLFVWFYANFSQAWDLLATFQRPESQVRQWPCSGFRPDRRPLRRAFNDTLVTARATQ